MASTRKSVANIHRIREFELEKVHLAEEFDILQIVGEGWFGKILLVEHRATDTEMVLKALPKPYVSLRDFYREFHYGLNLGGHKNIVTTYDVAFETAGFYVFTQEYAPLGDLTSNVSETGIGELHTKRVAKQIASALDYLHARDLVHRDVKLDNILIFKSDFSRVKLCDFGESRKSNSLVQRRNEWLPYSPPEVLSVRTDDTYKTDLSHDTWQFGIVIFVCLTGCLPWQKAASDDPRYVRYLAWINTSFPIKRTPKLFKLISGRACKMFRKFLEPREDRRPKNLADLHKYSDDRWLAKSAEKDLAAYEPDELCPSMYSFHSNPEEKNKLLSSLALYGIETTVDRVAKKNRIREWIQTSVIAEEDEENESGTTTPSSTMSRTPVAGHVSSIRAEEIEQQKTDDQKINSTIKDASNKHIDPRTCQIQEGPSEMGSANPSLTTQIIDSNHNNNMITSGKTDNLNSTQKDRHEAYANGNTMPFGQNDTNHNSPIGSQTLINARLNIPLAGQGVNIQTHNEQVLNFNDRNTDDMKKKLSISLGNIMNNYNNNNNYNKSTNGSKTSVGLISSFNTVSTAMLPESRMYQNKDNYIKDSGYGSSDRIKAQENIKSIPTSPVAVKRSSLKKSTNNNNYLTEHEDNPRDFDDLNDIRGSNGFVNLSGNKYQHLVHNRTISNKMKK